MRRGFTLIELLVAIGIIVVLAAIIFPTFSLVREKARQTHCFSNLRQLGLAMKEYESDYGGYTVASRARYSEWVGYNGYLDETWIPRPTPETGVLWTYVRDRRVYHCPSDDEENAVSYAVNRHLIDGAIVDDPSKMGMFADVTNGIPHFLPMNYGSFIRHSGGYNACYVDGHVKYRKYPDDLTSTDHIFFTGGDPRWEPPH